jgi:uncharacterized protein YkuJ
MRRLLLLAPLALLALAAACATGQDVETTAIVDTIPWEDGERAEYVRLTRDLEEELGTGYTEVTRQDGTYRLFLHFETEGIVDESTVVADAETLRPESSQRDIEREGERVVVDAEYQHDEEVVRITVIEEGDERALPLSLEGLAHYYDNESSLFLWRTVRFEEGYEASYNSVQPNVRSTAVVTLEVVGREEVTVPAGTFDTWRIELRFGDREQTAWYADTPTRPLIQYDNSREIFQLTSLEE